MADFRTGEGDLLKANVDALVNTINTVGVMGKGIALQFKKNFKENFEAYKKACDRNNIHLGEMFVQKVEPECGTLPRMIINFPTKKHWRHDSNIEDIERGLDHLVQVIQRKNISSIAIPALGCGEGGLDWVDVRTLIRKKLEPLANVEVHLFAPKGSQAITADMTSPPTNLQDPLPVAVHEDQGGSRFLGFDAGHEIEVAQVPPVIAICQDEVRPSASSNAQHHIDGRRMTVSDLIGAELLKPETLLIWNRPRVGTSYAACVLSTGQIKLADGRVFPTPTGAARAAAGTDVGSGWRLWRTPKGVLLADLGEALRVRGDPPNAEGVGDDTLRLDLGQEST